MKRAFALAALLLAAAPLHAQNARTHRFDGGTFSIALPAGIPALRLVGEQSGMVHTQFFFGRHADGSAVLVMRLRSTGLGGDTTEMRRTAERLTNDSTLIDQYVQSGDTSRAYRDQVRRALADTALDGRQYLLRQVRATISAANQPARLEFTGEPREIVTDERVTLRSRVTVRLRGLPPLHGTADMLVQRRGEMIVWIVAHVAPRRSPAFDAAAERVLASLRVAETP